MLLIFIYSIYIFVLVNFFWIEANDLIVLNFFLIFFFFFIYIFLKNSVKIFICLKWLKFYFIYSFLLQGIFFFLDEYSKILNYLRFNIINLKYKLNLFFFVSFLNFKTIIGYMYYLLAVMVEFIKFYKFFNFQIDFKDKAQDDCLLLS